MKSRDGKRNRREEKRREEKRREEKRRRNRIKEETVRRKKIQPRNTGSGGSKTRLTKAGAEPSGQMRDEKLHAVVAGSTFQVKMYKTHRHRTTFGPKVSKTWGFCDISKIDGRRGTFEEDLQKCMSRGRPSTRDVFIRDARRSGRSGRWFLERGCILERQIFRFAKMILRDRCSTLYDLASLLRGRRSTLHRWSGKIAKCIVRSRRLCTQLSIFEGSLAELFRFWCYQVQKLPKSRRIAASSSKIEEVSQDSFVFKLADR